MPDKVNRLNGAAKKKHKPIDVDAKVWNGESIEGVVDARFDPRGVLIEGWVQCGDGMTSRIEVGWYLVEFPDGTIYPYSPAEFAAQFQ